MVVATKAEIGTTRKHAKGPGQRYQLLLQPLLQYRLQKQLVPLASGDQRYGVWYRVKALPGTKTPVSAMVSATNRYQKNKE